MIEAFCNIFHLGILLNVRCFLKIAILVMIDPQFSKCMLPYIPPLDLFKPSLGTGQQSAIMTVLRFILDDTQRYISFLAKAFFTYLGFCFHFALSPLSSLFNVFFDFPITFQVERIKPIEIIEFCCKVTK